MHATQHLINVNICAKKFKNLSIHATFMYDLDLWASDRSIEINIWQNDGMTNGQSGYYMHLLKVDKLYAK